MGYRSDVAIGIAFPNREAMIGFLTSIKLKGDVIQPEELAHYKASQDTDTVILHARFSDVKWYDSYPDVQCHHRLINTAQAEDFATAFICIGEESNDVTMDFSSGEGDDDLYSMYGVRRELIAPEDGVALSEFINTNKE
jgi:hypothetical protein